jgi:hypothetical protein
MGRNRLHKALKLAVFGVAAMAILGLVVMSLWNWLMPVLFGTPAIGFWQALGLFGLGKLLFGGFHHAGSGRHGSWRRRMLERWAQMTPQERERFLEGVRPTGAAEAAGRD